ncbi:MAG: UDP-N-acetylmuramoyl-L-alanine--D-glutamate ligase [Firmicutes bacterium]|nr:UDP-N-acetylmuramoyl-L-alanine--D-glutamate ligase [Bacillota bacterium]
MLKKEGLLKVDLAGKNIIVVGGGLSGQAVCRYLVGQESKVTLFDDRSAEKFGAAAAELAALGVEMCLDGQIPTGAFALCLKSPGIPPTHPLLVQLADAKTPIIGEIELAYLTADAAPRFIGITGTNGKTTTTTLLELMLRQAGRATLLGGNIGAPLVGRMGGFGGSVVAELSSFQLEDSRELHINTALFLNLTPDHLDRHGDIEGYFAAKAKIFAHQTAADTVVLNADDEWCIRAAALTPARKLWFSLAPLAADQDGLELCDGDIRIKRGAEYTHLIRAAEIYIKGRHNWQNAMAASAAALAQGISVEQIAATLRDFRGVEHRLEFVCRKNGVDYYNDSKGTNPDSTTKAIEAFASPLVMILGGYDKGSDFHPLLQLVKEKVRYCIITGATAPAIKAAADAAGYGAYALAADFDTAVRMAMAECREGDTLLFSPACASWDAFPNYMVRGERFKQLVTEE